MNPRFEREKSDTSESTPPSKEEQRDVSDASLSTDKAEDLEAIRVQSRHQDRPAFFEETVLGKGEEGYEYREPTDTEREQMDRNIRKLADIFEDSGIRWLLVGSFSISVMKGDYFRNHKDIDIAIESDDLESLEQQLFLKGYALFLSLEHEDPQKRKMTWLSASEAREASGDLMIAAIDEQGKIRKTESLNYIDIHLTKRDEQGRPLGLYGVPLPKKWYEPQGAIFRGKNISLTHPAKEAYFKLYDGRKSAHVDLRALVEVGKLTLDDISEIGNVLEREFEDRRLVAVSFIERVVQRIATKSGPGEIFEVLMNDEEIARRFKRDENRKRIYEVAEFIAGQSDRSADNIKQIIMRMIGIDAKIAEERKMLQTLRQAISSREDNPSERKEA